MMLAKTLIALISACVMGLSQAQDASVEHHTSTSAMPSRPEVRLSIIKTARLSVVEGMLYAGGSWTRRVDSNFSAFWIRHGQENLMFDTGLGSQIGAQYAQGMPHWQRPFFRYEGPVVPAARQLADAKAGPVQRIILSHAHWDHASAVGDFPTAEVLVAPEELPMIHRGDLGVGGAWPSQLGGRDIHALAFEARPHMGFDLSADLFADGSIVVVPLPGHTPGSVGMFVTVSSGKRYFLVGDAVWNAGALTEGASKFWPARRLVDADSDRTRATIAQLVALQHQFPDLQIVPAHDGRVQGKLGYFPDWVP